MSSYIQFVKVYQESVTTIPYWVSYEKLILILHGRRPNAQRQRTLIDRERNALLLLVKR